MNSEVQEYTCVSFVTHLRLCDSRSLVFSEHSSLRKDMLNDESNTNLLDKQFELIQIFCTGLLKEKN